MEKINYEKYTFSYTVKNQFKENDVTYNYYEFHKSNNLFKKEITDNKNNLIFKEEKDHNYHKIFIDKDKINEDFAKQIGINEDAYENAEPINKQSKNVVDNSIDILNVKNNKNDFDICKVSDNYLIESNFVINHNGNVYKLKIENQSNLENNEFKQTISLSLIEPDLGKEYSGKIIISNYKNTRSKIVDLNKMLEINKFPDFLNKISNLFSFKCNIDFGNYDKLIEVSKDENEFSKSIYFNINNNEYNDIFQFDLISKNNTRKIEISILNDFWDTIYECKTEKILGNDIEKIKYNSNFFTEDLFNLFKKDVDMAAMMNKENYLDMIKNGIDLSKEKERQEDDLER